MKKISAVLLCVASFTISQTWAIPQPNNPPDSMPQWANNPVIEDGLAAATCVKAGRNFAISRKKAVAHARLSLAQQIEVNVKGLEETYMSQIDNKSGGSAEDSFVVISKQLTNETLNGSKAIKFGSALIDSVKHYCAMVALNPATTKMLFDKLIDKSRRELSAMQQQALFREFTLDKTQQELKEQSKRFAK